MSGRRRVRVGARAAFGLTLSCAVLSPTISTATAAASYAPVDAPGPALSVAPPALAQALNCTGNVASADRDPVLLVPGTTVTPQEFTWNWEPALTQLGRPYCTITLPGHSMADIQVAGEYVVYAIRTIHRQSGRRVVIIGHSQGGMVPRWALRFWPDVRPMVAQVIGMSPSNHGTVDAVPLCALGCAPAIWQQRNDAAFIAALNSYQETFPGIAYTNIYSHTDEVVVPNTSDGGSSSLHGGGGAIANVPIQQICPLDPSEHLAVGTYDNVTYRLVLDALTHGGPADSARIGSDACLQPLMPGVNQLTFATDYASTIVPLTATLATYPHVSAEPPLKCYVTATCPPPASPLPARHAPSQQASPRPHRRAMRQVHRRRAGRA